ncbi:unnamed protein product [Oreochromis niloticus]|nr:unnamed protein product [Mustela putorius furo]
MDEDLLKTRDLSLTLKQPTVSDSGRYNCVIDSITPEDTTVMWTRSDIDPKFVHLQGEKGGDDVRGQNQRYSRRTSMNRYAFIIKDFSLTLRKPTKTDNGNYTCSISAGGKERRLRDIQLQVKDQQVEVKVEEGSQSVILPCNTKPDLPEGTTVEWTRSDLGLITVDEYSNRNDDLMTQDEVYRDRTKMNEDLLRTGDLSLTLKHPTVRDSGGYICTIYRDKDILTQKVMLQVKALACEYAATEDSSSPPPNYLKELKQIADRSGHRFEDVMKQPNTHRLGQLTKNVVGYHAGIISWSKEEMEATDIKTKKLLTMHGGFHPKSSILRLYAKWKEGGRGLVEEGAESVPLPFQTTKDLPADAKVVWWDLHDRKVHVFSDQAGEQDEVYRDRTEMNNNPLTTGDLSLTLKRPTERDSGTYRCDVIRYKTVQLRVKGRVEVQDQTGDIRNRSSSIDPTPLMADQSV